jgi:hypothetical protein
MAAPSPPKADTTPFGLHSTGQDSAIQISDDAQQQQGPLPLYDPPTPPNPHDQNDDEYDSGFDSGSLLGDETDTLASSILHYRIENGRQYHAYRDGAYWVRCAAYVERHDHRLTVCRVQTTNKRRNCWTSRITCTSSPSTTSCFLLQSRIHRYRPWPLTVILETKSITEHPRCRNRNGHLVYRRGRPIPKCYSDRH